MVLRYHLILLPRRYEKLKFYGNWVWSVVTCQMLLGCYKPSSPLHNVWQTLSDVTNQDKFWYRVNIYGLKVTGAHKHKVESVGLALCLSRDNGDWYFSFVSSRIHSQVSDSKPNYTLVCPLKLSRKQMLETPDWALLQNRKRLGSFQRFPNSRRARKWSW